MAPAPAAAFAVAQPPTERTAGPGWRAENRTILDSLAYARRLGVSRRLLQEALRVKLRPRAATGAETSARVKELSERMAYPTDWVHNRNPMPVWYVGDVERHERESGLVPETSGGRWVRRPQRLSGYSEGDVLRAAHGCGLPEPERAVILRRYGLDGARPVSQASLAGELGVSERTVRTMERRASEAVAAWLDERGVRGQASAVRGKAGQRATLLACARCLTPKSSYSDEDAMLCSSCEDLYERVHDEVCREKDALKAQADRFASYVGDCRPYRKAFMDNLPLYALNRLARIVEAEDRGYGYAACGALRAGELVYAGNMGLLATTWHYREKDLRAGFEYLKRAGKIERRGFNPRDPRVEFWAVLAPYERPNLNVTLRRGRRLIPQ